jgi:hypothetical protein
MSRRIDIELTSSRDDGSWTWRAAGAREPRGTLDAAILPSGAQVGDVLRAEIEAYLDGLSVVTVAPPRAPRAEPDRLEIRGTGASDAPLVTTTLARTRPGERGTRRGDRSDRGDRGDRRDRERGRGDRERGRGDGRRPPRDRQEGHHEPPERPTPPPVETKPKPKRLRPGKTHRTALLDAIPAEHRPIAEQLLQGGIPSVRQAIDKQNAELRAAGKTEVKPDELMRIADELRHRASAAVWRDRAEAAAASADDLDLRDLRSVVNAADDAGRDDEARALATQLREALANRVEKEHAAWLAELSETLRAGRVVRALRLSSRPPKAGAPVPGDLANQLVEAASTALTDETGQERWATVLEALAFSPIRRRVVPQSLPTKLSPELRTTVARLGSRLPEIAHIFAIEPDQSSSRPPRPAARKRSAGKGDDAKGGDTKRKDRKAGRPARKQRPADAAPTSKPTVAPVDDAGAPSEESRPPEAVDAAHPVVGGTEAHATTPSGGDEVAEVARAAAPAGETDEVPEAVVAAADDAQAVDARGEVPGRVGNGVTDAATSPVDS